MHRTHDRLGRPVTDPDAPNGRHIKVEGRESLPIMLDGKVHYAEPARVKTEASEEEKATSISEARGRILAYILADGWKEEWIEEYGVTKWQDLSEHIDDVKEERLLICFVRFEVRALPLPAEWEVTKMLIEERMKGKAS